MAKTVADYYRDGHEAYNAGTALPFTDAKSWQQKAMLTGYNEALETNRVAHEQALELFGEPKKSMPPVVAAHIAEMQRHRNPKNMARVDAKIAKLQAKWGV